MASVEEEVFMLDEPTFAELAELMQRRFYFHEERDGFRRPVERMLRTTDLSEADFLYEGQPPEWFQNHERVNIEAIRLARARFPSLDPELKHRSLRSMSWGGSIKHLCGLEREEFWQVFEIVADRLALEFPHSPRGDEEEEEKCRFSSTSFRLFVVLFVLRTGTPREQCRFHFGWGGSTIDDWVRDILPIVDEEMEEYREFPTDEEQANMATEHYFYLMGLDRSGKLIEMYNKRMQANGGGVFTGAMSSVDGTYSITPRPDDEVQEDLYTGYKKIHARKLLVMNSLFTKAILAIILAPAKVADPMVWLASKQRALLVKLAVMLGDDAFIGYPEIIPPFPKAAIAGMHDLNPSMAVAMEQWNHAHSSNRISSEHVIGSLKDWAWVRGTAKFKMAASHEKFALGVRVIHSLHNAHVCRFDRSKLFWTLKD
jgi:hypothetical protein